MHRREQLLAVLAFAALAIPLVRVANRVLGTTGADRPYDVAYVPHGSALRLASPSIQLSAADYYWLQAVQYIGEPRARQRGFEKLFPLVDLITDLDPRHGYAYQTAGIVLSAERRLSESDRILQKGMEPGRPGWWTYPFYLAFNDYFYRGDYPSAARWAKIAARTPGARPSISHLALALDVKRGSPDDAVRFLEEMRAEARDPSTVGALDEQYRLAVLQREFARLDRAVAAFRDYTGRTPGHLLELVATGFIERIPAEPFGGTFYLDAQGNVHSSARDQRFRPAERARLEGSPPSPGRPPSP